MKGLMSYSGIVTKIKAMQAKSSKFSPKKIECTLKASISFPRARNPEMHKTRAAS